MPMSLWRYGSSATRSFGMCIATRAIFPSPKEDNGRCGNSTIASQLWVMRSSRGFSAPTVSYSFPERNGIARQGGSLRGQQRAIEMVRDDDGRRALLPEKTHGGKGAVGIGYGLCSLFRHISKCLCL